MLPDQLEVLDYSIYPFGHKQTKGSQHTKVKWKKRHKLWLCVHFSLIWWSFGSQVFFKTKSVHKQQVVNSIKCRVTFVSWQLCYRLLLCCFYVIRNFVSIFHICLNFFVCIILKHKLACRLTAQRHLHSFYSFHFLSPLLSVLSLSGLSSPLIFDFFLPFFLAFSQFLSDTSQQYPLYFLCLLLPPFCDVAPSRHTISVYLHLDGNCAIVWKNDKKPCLKLICHTDKLCSVCVCVRLFLTLTENHLDIYTDFFLPCDSGQRTWGQ